MLDFFVLEGFHGSEEEERAWAFGLRNNLVAVGAHQIEVLSFRAVGCCADDWSEAY